MNLMALVPLFMATPAPIKLPAMPKRAAGMAMG